jgi:hypothetical protein
MKFLRILTPLTVPTFILLFVTVVFGPAILVVGLWVALGQPDNLSFLFGILTIAAILGGWKAWSALDA